MAVQQPTLDQAVIVLWPFAVGGDIDSQRRRLYNALTRAQQWAVVIVQDNPKGSRLQTAVFETDEWTENPLRFVPLNDDRFCRRGKLAVIRRNAGIINGYAKRWSDGAAEFAKGIADYDVLLKAGPNKRYRIYQADLRMRMASALLAAGQPAEADRSAAAGISTFREIAHSKDVAFADIRVLVTYLLESPLQAVRDPKEALALLDQTRWRGQADTFEFNEVLADAYHENHRYREAADTMRKALALMPPTKAADPTNRARQEIEASLARFERDAK